MVIRLSIDDAGIDKATLFVATIKNQLPFATSQAINNVAFNMRKDLGQQTTKSFTNPTKFTQSAFRYTRSTKANLVAEVYADPSRRFFPTQIEGGTRRGKPYEGFLKELGGGALGSGRIVPSTRIVNVTTGNPRRTVFPQIQSGLSTTDQGGFFIGRPRGKFKNGDQALGVWQRKGRAYRDGKHVGKLLPVFIHLESKAPRYSPRFPMERVGMETAKRLFPSELNKALERAINSAR